MTEPFEVKAERLNQQIARVEKYFAHTYPGVSTEIQCAGTGPVVTLWFGKFGDAHRLRVKHGEGGYALLTSASLDLCILAAAHLHNLEGALRTAAHEKYGALDAALDTYTKFAREFHVK